MLHKKWHQKAATRWVIGVGLTSITIIFAVSALLGGSDVRIDSSRLIIADVHRATFQSSLSLTATVIPARTIYIGAVEGGRIEAVFVESGSLVNEGDTILQLSNMPLLLDIINREAQLFEQRNNLRNSRLELERNALTLQDELLNVDLQLANAQRDFAQQAVMLERRLISRNAYLSAQERYEYFERRRQLTVDAIAQDSVFREIQVAALESSVDRIEENLAIVRRNLGNLTVQAPASGLLTSLSAEIGESKAPGERCGQIDVVNDFKLRADVDEYYLDRVEPGQTAECALSGQQFFSVVSKVYPEVRNGRFEVEFEPGGDAPSDMRRGQTAHLKLGFGDVDEALLLPRGAFYQATSGQWVFVLDADGRRATMRPIRLGRQNPSEFEVLDGLQEGERVVVSSYQTFGDADVLILTNN